MTIPKRAAQVAEEILKSRWVQTLYPTNKTSERGLTAIIARALEEQAAIIKAVQTYPFIPEGMAQMIRDMLDKQPEAPFVGEDDHANGGGRQC